MAVRTETVTPTWRDGRVTSWLTTLDHKRIGILYIVGVRLLLRRRRDGAAHARAARPGEQRLHHGELLQPALHRARDDDGLPLRRPHPRGLRQLPRPAHDRRARHGVPPPERPLVLALPPRRARHPLELPRGRGRRDSGWTAYTPLSTEEFSPGSGQDLWILGSTSRRSRRSRARSTSSSRSTTCARRG